MDNPRQIAAAIRAALEDLYLLDEDGDGQGPFMSTDHSIGGFDAAEKAALNVLEGTAHDPS